MNMENMDALTYSQNKRAPANVTCKMWQEMLKIFINNCPLRTQNVLNSKTTFVSTLPSSLLRTLHINPYPVRHFAHLITHYSISDSIQPCLNLTTVWRWCHWRFSYPLSVLSKQWINWQAHTHPQLPCHVSKAIQ